MSALNLAMASRDKPGRISGYSKKARIMASTFAIALTTLMISPLSALAAEPYGATVGGKPVTSVERRATKDLGFGLSRDELLKAASTSRPLRLTPLNFGPKNLDGTPTPGK
jgi:hypothetical protein